MRICLFGGPGSGKSTTAMKLAADLKQFNYDVEYVSEFIKSWAFEKKVPKGFDQVYVFGKQMNAEDKLIQCGVKHLITDSPILLQIAYMVRAESVFTEELKAIALKFEDYAPSVNILLDRTGLDYKDKGRYEDLDQAIKMDNLIEDMLVDCKIRYEKIKSTLYSDIIKFVLSKVSA